MSLPIAPLAVLNVVFSDVYDGIKRTISTGRDIFIAQLEVGFSEYANKKYDRLSKLKTLLSPIDPIDLTSIFVRPAFSFENKVVDYDALLPIISSKRIVLISGIAGQGKSSLAKFMFCELCLVNHGYIPIFIELRDLDEDRPDFYNFALSELASSSPSITSSVFDRILRSGKLLLILDGYDEIKPKSRNKFAKELVAFSSKYENVPIVITTRPTQDFHGWHNASECRIQSLDEDQIREIVSKSPIHEDFKARFNKKIDDFMETHGNFMTNPLLLNMMIRTFMSGAEVPEKNHLFYRKAYETLRRDHDNMKFMYKREFHSGLQEDDFSRLWKSFCFYSFMKNHFKFSQDTIDQDMSAAIAYCGIKCDQGLALRDMMESASLILREGDEYFFLHRAFQEYFSAVFLREERLDHKDKVIDKIVSEQERGEVPLLLFSIDQPFIEEEYLSKRVDDFLAALRSKQHAIDRFLLVYLGVSLESREPDDDDELEASFTVGISGRDDAPLWSLWNFLQRAYGLRHSQSVISSLEDWLQSRQSRRGTSFEIGVDYKGSKEALDSSPLGAFTDDLINILVQLKTDIDRRKSIRDSSFQFLQ